MAKIFWYSFKKKTNKQTIKKTSRNMNNPIMKFKMFLKSYFERLIWLPSQNTHFFVLILRCIYYQKEIWQDCSKTKTENKAKTRWNIKQRAEESILFFNLWRNCVASIANILEEEYEKVSGMNRRMRGLSFRDFFLEDFDNIPNGRDIEVFVVR